MMTTKRHRSPEGCGAALGCGAGAGDDAAVGGGPALRATKS
jgi:hypothetical protein